jgi:hypothetical protein
MNVNATGDMGAPVIIYTVVAAILGLVVHIVFAVAVYDDAAKRKRAPVFVGPAIWGLATLLGGALVAALYWLMHHSTLASRPEERGSDVTGITPPEQ